MIKSPCIGVCTNKNDICIGCYRTLEQITNWTSYTNEEREQIMIELEEKYSYTFSPLS